VFLDAAGDIWLYLNLWVQTELDVWVQTELDVWVQTELDFKY